MHALPRQKEPGHRDPKTSDHRYTAKAVKAEALKSAATCTEPAVYYYSCAVCGAVEGSASHTFTSGNANGHSYSAWVTDQDATCTAAGKQHRTCASCGRTETREIAKLSHTDANGDYKCDVCSADMTPADLCPYCHGTHSGFPGVLIGFFHRIIYFFQHLFG